MPRPSACPCSVASTVLSLAVPPTERPAMDLAASGQDLEQFGRIAITFDYLLSHRVKLQNIFSSLRLVEIVGDIFGDIAPCWGPSKPWAGGSPCSMGVGQGTAGVHLHPAGCGPHGTGSATEAGTGARPRGRPPWLRGVPAQPLGIAETRLSELRVPRKVVAKCSLQGDSVQLGQ